MNISAIFLAILLASFAFANEVSFVNDADIDDLPTLSRRPAPCGNQCKFRMCNFNGETIQLPVAPFAILGAPKTAALPHVCRPGDQVGIVLRSGEAKVRVGNRFIPISRWSPTGLPRNFVKKFIQTYKVPFLPRSGIGRLSSSANQWSFLHDQCMILPITRYQRINPTTGRPTKILNASGPKECVAFRTTAPAIQVELTWDTSDDFDLKIVEPDGDVIDFNNKNSEYGKLNGDNNVGFCDTKLLSGKENVVYFPNPNIEKGRYRITITHYNKCASRPSNWKLNVVINGVLKITRSGFSAVGNEKVVGTAAFNWP